MIIICYVYYSLFSCITFILCTQKPAVKVSAPSKVVPAAVKNGAADSDSSDSDSSSDEDDVSHVSDFCFVIKFFLSY